MGADGHIAIYDWDMVVEQWGKERAEELAGAIITGYQEEPLFPNTPRLYHIYWGDNIWDSPFSRGSWYGSEEEKERVEEVLDWMESNATIVSNWEVWT